MDVSAYSTPLRSMEFEGQEAQLGEWGGRASNSQVFKRIYFDCNEMLFGFEASSGFQEGPGSLRNS